MYNGVLLINLAIALFALVAIESSSQRLGRTYAVLLFCAILLDISWLVLCAGQIWNISHKLYETFLIFSVKLSLSMQIVGFSLRLASSLLWIQMYRLGVSSVDNAASQEADFDLRNSFVNPSAHSMAREISHFDSTLGGSIYDPAFYSSLFEDARDNGYQMVEPVQRQAWDFGGNGRECTKQALEPSKFDRYSTVGSTLIGGLLVCICHLISFLRSVGPGRVQKWDNFPL